MRIFNGSLSQGYMLLGTHFRLQYRHLCILFLFLLDIKKKNFINRNKRPQTTAKFLFIKRKNQRVMA